LFVHSRKGCRVFFTSNSSNTDAVQHFRQTTRRAPPQLRRQNILTAKRPEFKKKKLASGMEAPGAGGLNRQLPEFKNILQPNASVQL